MTMVARSAVAVRIPVRGGSAAGFGGGLSLRRLATLLTGLVLAAVATLALTTQLAPRAPARQVLAMRHGPSIPSATRVPEGLAAAASASIGASEHAFWPVRRGGSLRTAGGGIASTFTASGTVLRVAQGTLGLSLTGVGRGRRIHGLTTAAPEGSANQVLYRYGSISEFFRNGPYGLEQGFTLGDSPQGRSGPLVLTVGVHGSLTAGQAGSQVLFRTPAGATALRYGQLSALDATGRRLPAQMQIRNGTLQLRIDDSRARYPLRIDPFIQQGSKLLGGGETGKGQFGQEVALSADGKTAVIGAPNDNGQVGAAWVFVRPGSTWEQQGSKLTGTGETGKGRFGYSVALSADGSTALIGGREDNSGVGAAWVFVHPGSTWEQQGSKLTGTGETGKGRFGLRVALSADGNTALIGAPGDNGAVGAAWVFVRAGSTWEQQGSKLTGTGETGAGELGIGVALSADGNTALVGGGGDNSGVGAAWVFVRPVTTWEQQGSKLTVTGEVGSAHLGFRVALSEHGNTALVGGGGDNGEVGAAWVFVRSGTTWEQQGSKLTGSGEVGEGHFGYSVALSADGNTALIGGLGDHGGKGAAWAFTRSGSTWEQQGSKITGGGETGVGNFGSSVSLSADGNIAMIGGAFDGGEVGAAWGFHQAAGPPPTVTSIAPTSGTSIGGTAVKIKGTGFTTGATVTIGSGATGVVVVSATEITAKTSATAVGSDPVVVSETNGTSTGGPSYTYIAPPPPTVTTISPTSGSTLGGTAVSLTGTGFVAGATVTIGNSATAVVVVSAAKITAKTSATAAGSDAVVVSDANGTSTGGPSYTYLAPPPPTVTTIAPTSGSTLGGTAVTLTGTGFVAGASVTIGSGATAVVVVSATKITAKTAATAAGSDPVVVKDANGTSTGGPSYTYVAPSQPSVTSIAPTTGPVAGGTSVTITGKNLTAGPTPVVEFGATAAPNITSFTATKIVVVSPQAPAIGTVHVTVTTAGGTSATGTKDQFTYTSPGLPTVTSVSPSSGPTAGGTPVTIKGTGFLSGATVTIGSAATSVKVESPTELKATTATTAAGSDAVVVKDANGTSTGGPTFTYDPQPTVTEVTPPAGPTAGGTTVKIIGTGFLEGASVTIGAAATSVKFNSATELEATTAAGTGTPEVVVTDTGGTSTSGVLFTYVPLATVTSVSPTAGPAAGGTPVEIKGTGFVVGQPTTVKIGAAEASEVLVMSSEVITATTGAAAVGAAEVVVEDAGGLSTGSTAMFTYE